MKDSHFLNGNGSRAGSLRRLPNQITRLALFACTVGAAFGGTVTYNSQSQFVASAGSLSTINFSAPNGSYTTFATGLTLSGVTFTGTQAAGESVTETSQNYCCSTYARGFDSLNPTDSFLGPSSTEGISVALPGSGSMAFGFSLFSVIAGNSNGSNQDMVDIAVNGQTYTVDTAAAPTAIFFGIISTTTPITNITITPEQGNVQIDLGNVEFGSSASAPSGVPEPATGWLVGLPLLAIASGLSGAKKLLRR